jgi:hypothetical protein
MGCPAHSDEAIDHPAGPLAEIQTRSKTINSRPTNPSKSKMSQSKKHGGWISATPRGSELAR